MTGWLICLCVSYLWTLGTAGDTCRHVFRRVVSSPRPPSHSEWRDCVLEEVNPSWAVPPGQARGGSFPRCPMDTSERNDRLWVGPQIKASSGASQPPGSPWQQLFPCCLLKGNYVTAGTRQLSFVNIFSPCIMLEKDTHLQTTFRNYRHSQSSFKNDVAI